jgi:hypothetical protein
MRVEHVAMDAPVSVDLAPDDEVAAIGHPDLVTIRLRREEFVTADLGGLGVVAIGFVGGEQTASVRRSWAA